MVILKFDPDLVLKPQTPPQPSAPLASVGELMQTVPSPATDAPADTEYELTEWLDQLDVRALRTMLIDLDSMTCQSSWTVRSSDIQTPEPDQRGHDSTFPRLMATIVHLNQTPAAQTLTRMLDARRWAFAWRIDERRVAVTEACYRTPRAEQRAGDTDLVRRICDAGMEAGKFEPTEAMNDRSHEAPRELSGNAPADRGADAGVAVAPSPARAGSLEVPMAAGVAMQPNPQPHPGKVGAALTRGAMTLICGGLLTAAFITVLHQQATSALADTLRLQNQIDNTLRQRLSTVLSNGDYGEVQAELDSFATLKYFDAAVVTNARQRVVAMAGEVAAETRIGDTVPQTVERSARIFDLGDNDSKTGPAARGQLLAWGAPGPPAGNATSQRTLFAAGLAMCMAAVVGGAALLMRNRQRRQAPAQQEHDRPDSASR